jgi:hypothetical protein
MKKHLIAMAVGVVAFAPLGWAQDSSSDSITVQPGNAPTESMGTQVPESSDHSKVNPSATPDEAKDAAKVQPGTAPTESMGSQVPEMDQQQTKANPTTKPGSQSAQEAQPKSMDTSKDVSKKIPPESQQGLSTGQ